MNSKKNSTQYRIITCTRTNEAFLSDELESKIDWWLKQGWQPKGGVTATQNKKSDIVYSQAIVK